MIKVLAFVAGLLVGLGVAGYWGADQMKKAVDLETKLEGCGYEEIRLETMTPQQHYDQAWKHQERAEEMLEDIYMYTLEAGWFGGQSGWKEQADE